MNKDIIKLNKLLIKCFDEYGVIGVSENLVHLNNKAFTTLCRVKDISGDAVKLTCVDEKYLHYDVVIDEINYITLIDY